MTTVGATCEVHLMLKGMVDAEKEVTKLEERIAKLEGQVDKLKKAMSIEGYEEKVSRSGGGGGGGVGGAGEDEKRERSEGGRERVRKTHSGREGVYMNMHVCM